MFERTRDEFVSLTFLIFLYLFFADCEHVLVICGESERERKRKGVEKSEGAEIRSKECVCVCVCGVRIRRGRARRTRREKGEGGGGRVDGIVAGMGEGSTNQIVF